MWGGGRENDGCGVQPRPGIFGNNRSEECGDAGVENFLRSNVRHRATGNCGDCGNTEVVFPEGGD
jgi:hypothetical protein